MSEVHRERRAGRDSWEAWLSPSQRQEAAKSATSGRREETSRRQGASVPDPLHQDESRRRAGGESGQPREPGPPTVPFRKGPPDGAGGAGPPRSGKGWLSAWTDRWRRVWSAQGGMGRYWLALVVLGGALMVLGEPADTPPRQAVAPAAVGPVLPPLPEGETADELERRLAAILSQIAGVGEVRVMVTLATGPEKVLATESSVERRTAPDSGGREQGAARVLEERVTSRPITVRDEQGRQEVPVVQMERAPRVRGVVVVADGAADPEVRLAITRAVAAALDVAAYRIQVYPRQRP